RRLGPAARVQALEVASPPGIRGGRTGDHPLHLAGEGGRPGTPDLGCHSRRALPPSHRRWHPHPAEAACPGTRCPPLRGPRDARLADARCGRREECATLPSAGGRPMTRTREGSLMAWQWSVYPGTHHDRRNLLVHALTVPVFQVGTVALVLSPFVSGWLA